MEGCSVSTCPAVNNVHCLGTFKKKVCNILSVKYKQDNPKLPNHISSLFLKFGIFLVQEPCDIMPLFLDYLLGIPICVCPLCHQSVDRFWPSMGCCAM